VPSLRIEGVVLDGLDVGTGRCGPVAAGIPFQLEAVS
jgi:hypothetical protein